MKTFHPPPSNFSRNILVCRKIYETCLLTNMLTVEYTSADLYEKEPDHSAEAYLTIRTVQASSLHNKIGNKPVLHMCLLYNFH